MRGNDGRLLLGNELKERGCDVTSSCLCFRACFGEHEVSHLPPPRGFTCAAQKWSFPALLPLRRAQATLNDPCAPQVSPVPCHRQGRFPCSRPCGRPLTCGNHSCSRDCHLVTNGNQVATLRSQQMVDNGDVNQVCQWDQYLSLSLSLQCEMCEEGCSKPRPPGCPHTCPRPCHPGNCPPCSQRIRQRCHCKISAIYVECTSVRSVTLHNVTFTAMLKP